MHTPTKSYLTVLQFMAQYFQEEGDSDLIMNDPEENQIINVITDSDGHIQVCITDMDENELDGGGLVVMQDEDEQDYDGEDTQEEGEGTRIARILKEGTPEEITELVTEKALFIWDLIHSS